MLIYFLNVLKIINTNCIKKSCCKTVCCKLYNVQWFLRYNINCFKKLYHALLVQVFQKAFKLRHRAVVQSVSITTAWLWTTGSVVTKMPMGKKGGAFSFEELTCPDVSQNGWLSQRGEKRTLWPTPQVKSTKTNPLSLLWIEALTSLQVFGFCLLQHHS